MSSPAVPAAPCISPTRAGSLSAHATAWQSVSVPDWVIRTVTTCYKLQFARKPPRFSGILSSHTEESSAHVLKDEISSLLEKGAVRVIPSHLYNQGFYSRYFLVPKKDGSLRPILDLRLLNKHLRTYNFRMLTHGTLSCSIHQNDWFTSVDLKDAFFHISIYPPHRKFLRFAYQGVCYEFTVLPFGLSLSPRVFCLCAEAGLAPLRIAGLRILTYIDNWLIIADSAEEVMEDTRRVIAHITSLGFRVNKSKSNFSPSHITVFLGRSAGTVSRMSQITGSYGIGNSSFASGPSENEGLYEVGPISPPQPLARSQSHRNSDVLVLNSAAPLEEDGVLHSWNSGRSCCRNHTRGQNSGWCVAKHSSLSPYKLFGAPLCVEGSKAFFAPPAGTSCADTLRQHHCSSIYKSPREHGFLLAPCSGSQAVAMEKATFFVCTSHSCSGRSEQGSGPSIEGESALWRLASPPSGSGPCVAEIRPGGRRSLRLAQKRPLSYVFLATGRGRTPRHGRAGPLVATSAALCVPSSLPDSAYPGQGERSELVSSPDSTQVAQSTMDGGDFSSVVCPAMAPPITHGPPVPGEWKNLPPPPGQGGSLGLARERANLNTFGLPARVIATIQNARAASMRSLYDCKWRVFEKWCDGHRLISYQCSVADILCFLQDLIDKGRSFSTIKVYLAAIAACHVGFDGTSVGQHPLLRRFMKGARRFLPTPAKTVPEWDLSMVLESLSRRPFEPLGDISLKHLSFKTALLLALTSAKRVSVLHALSVHHSCTKFYLDGNRVFLRHNPAFMPKCFPAVTCEVIELSAFHPPPFSSAEDERLHALCPVRALRVYMDRTKTFRKSDQLFISWAPPHTGNPIFKQRLSHWLVEAISMAYESMGVQPPGGLRAHSTRGMAASWALFSWTSPHSFVRYYRLDVTRTPVAHSVLGVGSS
ncbi:hypothetical protein IRJ41_002448 [Triplophysa rosa]|uniref:ribonuclease H n=1 Tax=Triplophysa rosa TaxID=992332 RepID=A0A9W7T6A3_TRIRA|nr:hypothetical protein IRJ41_002448 [Triplophysa rosa]